MNIEGPGDGADRLPVADEFPGHLLLVRAHFLRPAEGDAARLGGYPAVGRPADNEGALELGGLADDAVSAVMRSSAARTQELPGLLEVRCYA